MYSNSASDYGVGKIDFLNSIYTINKIAYSESVDNNQKISYVIENRSVSKEEFEVYIAEQNKKDTAIWQEYTLDT